MCMYVLWLVWILFIFFKQWKQFFCISVCVCVLSAFPLVKSAHFLTFFSFHSLQHIILHFSVSTVLYCTIHIHNIPPPTPINWSEATVTTTVQKSHSLEFSLVFHWICPVTLPLCRRTSILTRNCRTQEISWCLCVYIHIVLWRWRWWWWWRFVVWFGPFVPISLCTFYI